MIRIVNGEIVRDGAPEPMDDGRSSRRSSHTDPAVGAQHPLPERQNSVFDQLEEPMPVFGHMVAKKWLGAFFLGNLSFFEQRETSLIASAG